MWDEWGRLTRFLESTRIALAREDMLWRELELKNSEDAKLRVVNGKRNYEVFLSQHRDAVADEWILFASALMYSYALVEAVAEDSLGKPPSKMGGVEVWAEALLQQAGNAWADVKGGKAGIVEVSIVRNIIAHGSKAYSQSDVNRILAAGGAIEWKQGDAAVLTYDVVTDFRARLKSLLRVCKLGGASNFAQP